MWGIPLKNKYSETLTSEFSNILTTSKRKPIKIESDRGAEIYNNVIKYTSLFSIHGQRS